MTINLSSNLVNYTTYVRFQDFLGDISCVLVPCFDARERRRLARATTQRFCARCWSQSLHGFRSVSDLSHVLISSLDRHPPSNVRLFIARTGRPYHSFDPKVDSTMMTWHTFCCLPRKRLLEPLERATPLRSCAISILRSWIRPEAGMCAQWMIFDLTLALNVRLNFFLLTKCCNGHDFRVRLIQRMEPRRQYLGSSWWPIWRY